MRILVFGATGSIGTQTVKVIENEKNYKLVGISYFRNEAKAFDIIKKHKLKFYFKSHKNPSLQIKKILQKTKPDLVVNAVSGFAGCIYSIITVANRINLALANKETLVCFGKFIIPLAKKNKVKILPIDSELAALCVLMGENKDKNKIKKIFITGSGGKFWKSNSKKINACEYKECVKHKNWNMGEKVSIDSATLINKFFEIIEAYWLFDKIRVSVLCQRESIIHALIQNTNKKLKLFIAPCDMRIPIKLAISKFLYDTKSYIKNFKSISDVPYKLEKLKNPYFPYEKYASLFFKNPNSAIPIIINSADEMLIKLFKLNKIKILNFYNLFDKVINDFKNFKIEKISDVFKLNAEIKKKLKSDDYLNLLH